jgi:hypothetical protein
MKIINEFHGYVAITVKSMGPTNTRWVRYKVSAGEGRKAMTFTQNDELSTNENYHACALKYAESMGWTNFDYYAGHQNSGIRVYVPVPTRKEG